jgi:uncharacterized protein YkwD
MAADSKTADFRVMSRVMDLINRERARENAPPLGLSVQLCEVAQAHCQDMVRRGFFSNVDPDGVDLVQKVARTGYRGKCCANLSMGADTEVEVVTSFMNSETQRDYCLDRQHLHLGVGRVGEAWTVLFGIPEAKVEGPDLQAPLELLDLVNRERQKNTLLPVRISEQLNQVAHAHCVDMVARNYVSAKSLEGESIGDKARRAGYQGKTGACVASGTTAASSAVDLWLKNEGNRATLLGPDYRYLGGAVANSRWTLIMGTAPVSANATPELLHHLLDMINDKRAMNELPILSLEDRLTRVAQDHCQEMVVHKYVGAQGERGQGVEARIQASKYPGRTACCFLEGETTPEAALFAWLKNGADKKNLFGAEYKDLGIGVMESRWTLIFGVPLPVPVGDNASRCAKMVELINIERSRMMVAPLQPNERLNEAAQGHAVDMVKRSFTSGTNPDGENVGPRVNRARYPWKNLIEFVGEDASAEELVKLWMGSTGHRAHILSSNFVHIGVGVAHTKWDVILGRPQ